MRGGEPDPPDPVDLAGRAQPSREGPAGRRRIAIAVHVLTEQLDLGVTHARQLPRFLQYALASAAALGPPRERNHAIGAALVAAFDDGHIGAMRIVTACEGRLE